MLSTTMPDEFYVTVPDYDDTVFCTKCDGFIGEEPYILRYNGEVMCADCIERTQVEDGLSFIRYDNIFDVLDRFNILEYAC